MCIYAIFGIGIVSAKQNRALVSSDGNSPKLLRAVRIGCKLDQIENSQLRVVKVFKSPTRFHQMFALAGFPVKGSRASKIGSSGFWLRHSEMEGRGGLGQHMYLSYCFLAFSNTMLFGWAM